MRHAAQLGNPSTPSAKLIMHKRPSLMRLWKLMLDPFLFPLRPEMLMSEPNTGSKAKCSMQLKSLWQTFVYIVLLFAPRNAKGIYGSNSKGLAATFPLLLLHGCAHAKEHAALSKWLTFITHTCTFCVPGFAENDLRPVQATRWEI